MAITDLMSYSLAYFSHYKVIFQAKFEWMLYFNTFIIAEITANIKFNKI